MLLNEQTNACPLCLKDLPAGWPVGLCPHCALRSALDPEVTEFYSKEDTAVDGDAPRRQRIGNYDLLEELGRGGMGVVYRARQVPLNREVAVKMIISGDFASRVEVERFHSEARAAADLHHPAIVAIHEIGEQDGLPYFSMDYVRGVTLNKLVAEQPMAPSEAARLIKEIAEAIHYAHQHGVLHRDLKPSNIVITQEGGPRIMDFGLAKRLNEGGDLTESGQVLGSPAFMPPEQAEGRNAEVTVASDVYSLGALLFFVLTRRPPFTGASPTDVLQAVIQAEPSAPRLIIPSIPRNLDTICLKCLSKAPGSRYQSAQELADDLGRFLSGEPIHARPAGACEKLWRWCRRKPALALALAALALVFLAGFTGVFSQWRRAEALVVEESRERRSAILERRRAEAGREVAQSSLYASDINLAARALEDTDRTRALDMLEHQRPKPRALDLRGWEWRYLWAQAQGDEVTTLQRENTQAKAMSFSPDGQWLATADAGGTIRLWDFIARTLVATTVVENPVHSLAFSPDGQWLASGGEDFQVRVWNRSLQRVGPILAHTNVVRAVAWSPNGEWLATGGNDCTRLWNTRTWTEHPIRPGPAASRILFCDEGRQIAVAAASGVLLLWDIASEKEVQTVAAHRERSGSPYAILEMIASPDGKTIVTSGADRSLQWRSAATLALEHRELATSLVSAMGFANSGAQLYLGGSDGNVRIWNANRRLVERVMTGHRGEIWDLAVSKAEGSVVTAGFDRTFKVWSPQTQPKSQNLRRPLPPKISDWLISADGQLLTFHDSQIAHVWSTSDLQEVASYPPPRSRIYRAVAADNGRKLTMWLGDGSIVAVAPVSKEVGRHVSGPVAGTQLMASINDGQTVITATADGMVKLWDVTAGRLEGEFSFRSRGLVSMDVSHGLIAATFTNRLAEVWSLTNQAYLRTIKGPGQEGIRRIVFSKDAALLATAGFDGTVRTWDTDTGREIPLPGKIRAANSVLCFSPEARRLFVCDRSGHVDIHDRRTLRALLSLNGHEDEVRRLAFTRDGNRLITVSHENVCVWEAVSRSDVGM